MSYTRVSKNDQTGPIPKFSIILPFYNTAKYLPLCLDSALSQTFQDFEIIAIDDGSTDNSLDIVLDYAARDSRIYVFKNAKNSGVSIAANVGIENARARLIARLDSDDMYEPNKLAIQFRFFQENPEHVLVGGAVRIIDTVKKTERIQYSPRTHDDILNKIFAFIPCQHSTIVFNRDLLPKDFSWYDPQTQLAEDLDIIFRIAEFGVMCNLDDVLSVIFERPESLSQLDVKKSFRHVLNIQQRAIQHYGFNPGLKSRFTMLCQRVIVKLTPAAHLFSVFHMIRKYI